MLQIKQRAMRWMSCGTNMLSWTVKIDLRDIYLSESHQRTSNWYTIQVILNELLVYTLHTYSLIKIDFISFIQCYVSRSIATQGVSAERRLVQKYVARDLSMGWSQTYRLKSPLIEKVRLDVMERSSRLSSFSAPTLRESKPESALLQLRSSPTTKLRHQSKKYQPPFNNGKRAPAL